MTDTEIKLSIWRSGSTQAERLVAAVLRLEGYSNVEAQAPIGGADNRADVLCDRGGYRYVAAAFFPPTQQTFNDVRGKFMHDIDGTRRHSRSGFLFFTNQRLTLQQRSELKELALRQSVEAEVFDVERIRGALDEPSGYGIRAAFLAITMSDSEQIAYFSLRERNAEIALEKNTAELQRIADMMLRLESQNRAVAHTVQVLAGANFTGEHKEPIRLVDPLPMGELSASTGGPTITQFMSPELILMTHRLTCFELPSRMIGRFRDTAVTLVSAGEAARERVEPGRVPECIRELCSTWNTEVGQVQNDDEKTSLIAKFHQSFLMIHPFADGNGRTSRALLLQQCLDLFGQADMSRLDRGVPYADALVAADEGDMSALTNVIRAVVRS